MFGINIQKRNGDIVQVAIFRKAKVDAHEWSSFLCYIADYCEMECIGLHSEELVIPLQVLALNPGFIYEVAPHAVFRLLLAPAKKCEQLQALPESDNMVAYEGRER